MRQTISRLVAAITVVIASAAPAMACGLFGGPCSPCGPAYVSPCAQTDSYWGCNSGCGGWAFERLSDPALQYGARRHYPLQQYYYVNQGPTFTGPGAFAPYPTYQEGYYDRGRYANVRASRYHGRREHVLRRYY
ncbi:MAG: hypothetical protein QOI87_325 [Bradyrhizobium sp.]|jgi:hypothetical protein|nr:hypothetical protein [Bradyrhizobium sp.]